MNARKALLSLSALSALTLASCGTLNRAGKDLMLGVGTPALFFYGGATDGYSSAESIGDGVGSNGLVQVVSFPFTFLYHGVKHTLYGAFHLVDLPFCLFYGLAEAHPSGPVVKPLPIYQGTWFDKWAERGRSKSTDGDTGEMVPKD